MSTVLKATGGSGGRFSSGPEVPVHRGRVHRSCDPQGSGKRTTALGEFEAERFGV
jgi:hypothetical protein